MVLLAAALGLGLIGLVAWRSGLARSLVLAGVGNALGAEVDATSVSVGRDARVVARGVRVRVPGIDGPAAELFEAERVEISGTWGDLLGRTGRFDALVLTKPRLRVSRDKTTGEINLSALRVPTSPDGAVVTPPSVEVRDGVLELGEHGGGTFELLRSLGVEGTARPDENAEAGGYEIAFSEDTISDTEGVGLALRGLITPGGVTLTLDGLDLARWGPEHMPEQFREVFALMRIEGGIPSASLRVADDGAALGVVELDGVSMNLPFDAEGGQAAPEEMVRLRGVTGRVEVTDRGATATLRGTLGDLPSVVRLEYEGLSADSAFRCEIQTRGFTLRSDPEILPLAPGIVKRRLADFSNPTATVDATVFVERGPPSGTEPAPVRVRGELAFRDGSAAFEGFPYRFDELEGLARFDDERIEIVRVRGVSAGGARLHATGEIRPPRSGAQVDLRIRVDDVPLDEAFLGALRKGRREIVSSLMHEPSYRRLQELGLVRAPGEAGSGPEFALGGTGSVLIEIHRPLGMETNYRERIDVRLPRVGLTPAPFPLPIIAEDLHVTIDGGQARIAGGRFSGLAGGSASVSADVDLTPDEGSPVRLEIEAADVPADALLVAALPGGLDERPEARSPAEVLRRLGVRGVIDCTASVGPRPSGALGYDIGVRFSGLSARPEAREPGEGIELVGMVGELSVSEHDLTLAVRSGLAATNRPRTEPPGALELEAHMDLRRSPEAQAPAPGPFSAVVVADLSDIGLRLEDLVAVVAPEQAERLGALRAERRPEGAVLARVDIAGDAGADGRLDRLDVTLESCEALRFDAGPERLEVSVHRGSVGLSALEARSATFNDLSASLGLVGEPACAVEATGRAPVGRGWQPGDELHLRLGEVRLASELFRSAMRGVLSEGALRALEDARVRGMFDADLRLAGVSWRDRAEVTGEIRPRRLEMVLDGRTVAMHAISGAVVLSADGGRFDSLHARGEGWRAEVGGEWVSSEDGSALVEATLTGHAEDGLSEAVRAMLPPGLRDALGAIGLTGTGPLRADSLRLRLSLDGRRVAAHAAEGRISFSELAADVGLRIEDASGYADFSSESEPGAAMANFGLGVVLERGTAAGVRFSDAALRIASDPASGSVMVPALRAEVYGGRLSGSALILGAGDPDRAAQYEADFKLSGAPLGEMLADWEYASAPPEGVPPSREPAESRGIVDAGLSLAGRIGEPGSRRGRGTVTVGGEGTRVVRLPLLLPLIEVGNLQIPRNDPLDFGEAEFLLDGQRVVFERLGVYARSVRIFGYGQMTLPEMELDLRFSSRAISRVPVVSDIVERLRDELVLARVGGTLDDPRVSTEQFTLTRRLLAGVLGDALTEEERLMLEIERQSRETERRERRAPTRGAATDAGGP